MGMTIKEAIKVLEQHHMWTGEPQEIIDVKVENSAMDVGIDTMRKYQKIQEIVRWNNAPSPYYKPDGQLFREICEVLENGNDD